MDTEITLRRTNDAVALEGRTTHETVTLLDGSPDIGGVNAGPRPTELLLMALGGCTSMDVLDILNKMRQPITRYEVKVSGIRREEHPRIFTHIHIHYRFAGDLDPDKVARAIELSVTKYCSIHATVAASAQITHDFEIVTA